MTNRRPFRRPPAPSSTALRAALLAAAIGLSGCFGGGARPQSLYLLTPRATPAPSALPLSVGVGPVRVAPFLKRPQIVTHAGGGDLTVAAGRRWSEPLDEGIQRVLLQNLVALTGADLRNFPWTRATMPQYALRVDVTELDRAADGDALLEASWMLEDIAGGRLLESHRERLTAPVAGGGDRYAALADAYSDLFAQLAQRMAQALAARPAP